MFKIVATEFYPISTLDDNGDTYLETRQSEIIISCHRQESTAARKMEKIVEKNHGRSPYALLEVRNPKGEKVRDWND